MNDPNIVRVFSYRENRKLFAYRKEFFATIGLTDESVISEKYDGLGRWDEFEVGELTGATLRDIRQLSRAQDAQRGFIYDESLETAARVQVMVDRWTFVNTKGEPIPATMAGYASMAKAFTDILDADLHVRLYGGAIDERFLECLNALTGKLLPSNPTETTSDLDTTTATDQ